MPNNPDRDHNPTWINHFPQEKFGPFSIDPIGIVFGIPILAASPFADTEPLRATIILLGLAIILVGIPHTQQSFANRQENAIQLDDHGRSIIKTQFAFEYRTIAAIMLLTFAALMFTLGYWSPFADLGLLKPGDRGKEILFLYASPFFALGGINMLVQRPWRRRLVFSPTGLSYRRYWSSVTIPWDTIDDVTADTFNYIQFVTITARPPAELPALRRTKLDDGSTKAALAIYGMTVDPSTIAYAIQRLAAEPEARDLLTTDHGLEELFIGPSLDERIAMEPGQTWTRPQPDESPAD